MNQNCRKLSLLGRICRFIVDGGGNWSHGFWWNLAVLIAIFPTLAMLTGCNLNTANAISSNAVLSITSSVTSSFARSAEVKTIDIACGGCNSLDSMGRPVEQFAATFVNGSSVPLTWSVSGGDPVSGPGSIIATGQFMPPGYWAEDSVQIVVTAHLQSNPSIRASTVLQVTPGFRQPLIPENAAVGANGEVNITGYLSEAGGNAGISFEVSNTPTGGGAGLGTLTGTVCRRDIVAFTSCTVTYLAPEVAVTGTTYVVVRIDALATRIAARILVNSSGVSSNPVFHQAKLATPLKLGSSGGNSADYDVSRGRIVDCCSGTLGALLQGSDNKQYLLSNNHVLARSDHGNSGESIIQPGLIDTNCTPKEGGSDAAAVATLTGWLALNSNATNADAAIAEVSPGAVDSTGSILEMGARQPDGTLAAAPLASRQAAAGARWVSCS